MQSFMNYEMRVLHIALILCVISIHVFQ